MELAQLEESIEVGGARARSAVVVLTISGVVAGIDALLNGGRAALYWSSADEAAVTANPMQQLLLVGFALMQLVNFPLLVVSMVFFLRWVHRSTMNAQAMQSETIGTDPASAVWSYFIPLVNLVVPMIVMRDIDKASEPAEIVVANVAQTGPIGYRDAAAVALTTTLPKAPYAAWWIAYMGRAPLGLATAAVGSGAGTARVQTSLAFLTACLGVVAALLAVRCVERIEARQRERVRRMRVRESEVVV